MNMFQKMNNARINLIFVSYGRGNALPSEAADSNLWSMLGSDEGWYIPLTDSQSAALLHHLAANHTELQRFEQYFHLDHHLLYQQNLRWGWWTHVLLHSYSAWNPRSVLITTSNFDWWGGSGLVRTICLGCLWKNSWESVGWMAVSNRTNVSYPDGICRRTP